MRVATYYKSIDSVKKRRPKLPEEWYFRYWIFPRTMKPGTWSRNKLSAKCIRILLNRSEKMRECVVSETFQCCKICRSSPLIDKIYVRDLGASQFSDWNAYTKKHYILLIYLSLHKRRQFAWSFWVFSSVGGYSSFCFSFHWVFGTQPCHGSEIQGSVHSGMC